jgi:hypothetical protein
LKLANKWYVRHTPHFYQVPPTKNIMNIYLKAEIDAGSIELLGFKNQDSLHWPQTKVVRYLYLYLYTVPQTTR